MKTDHQRCSKTARALVAAVLLLPAPAFAAVSLGGWMNLSSDDISGLTTLSGDSTASVTLPFTFTVEG
jgi:hypothetical protein